MKSYGSNSKEKYSKPAAKRGGIRNPAESGENKPPKKAGNSNFHATAKKAHPLNNRNQGVMRGGIRF